VVHSIYYTTPTAQIRLLLLLPPSLNPRTSPETFAISRTNYCTGPTLTQLLLGTDRKLKDFWINLKSKFDELRTLEVNSEDGEEDRSWKALHTRFQRKIQQEMFLGFRFVRESVIALHLASQRKSDPKLLQHHSYKKRMGHSSSHIASTSSINFQKFDLIQSDDKMQLVWKRNHASNCRLHSYSSNNQTIAQCKMKSLVHFFICKLFDDTKPNPVLAC
jgi:hypothetical protein